MADMVLQIHKVTLLLSWLVGKQKSTLAASLRVPNPSFRKGGR